MYAGFLSCVLYDLMLPICCGCSIFLRALSDLFLCAATAFMLFFALYLTGSSSVRIYMPAAFALGAVICRLSVHKLVTGFVKYISRNRKNRTDGE